MPSASGTSIKGRQTLLNATSATTYQVSVAITSQPLPPPISVGYFYLYQYKNSGNFQSHIVLRGRMYRPGIWEIIPVRLFDNTFAYRFDVVWDVAGLPWFINLV